MENTDIKLEKEKCIVCKVETDIPVDQNINYRLGYIEGAGQLCGKCWKEIYSNPKLSN